MANSIPESKGDVQQYSEIVFSQTIMRSKFLTLQRLGLNETVFLFVFPGTQGTAGCWIHTNLYKLPKILSNLKDLEIATKFLFCKQSGIKNDTNKAYHLT